MFDWAGELRKAMSFIESRLAQGDDISVAARKAWEKEGFSMLTVKNAVQQVMQVESREAARLVVKANSGVERRHPDLDPNRPRLK